MNLSTIFIFLIKSFCELWTKFLKQMLENPNLFELIKDEFLGQKHSFKRQLIALQGVLLDQAASKDLVQSSFEKV